MVKLNNFWFGFLLALSISVSVFSFILADELREIPATGGEVFTIALPFLILKWRMWTIEQGKKKRQKNLY
jgi:hypothetical protein